MVALRAVLAAVLLVPAVAAQASSPTDSQPSIVVKASPSSNIVIPLGSTLVVNVTVSLSYTYLLCPSGSTVSVGLTLTDAGLPGVTGTLPTAVDVAIPPSMTGQTTTQTGKGVATLSIVVGKTTAADHDHAFTIKATTAATTPTGCNAMSPNPPKAGQGQVDVAIRTGPKPVTAASGSSSAASSSSGSQKSPALELPALGLLLVAFARRRDGA